MFLIMRYRSGVSNTPCDPSFCAAISCIASMERVSYMTMVVVYNTWPRNAGRNPNCSPSGFSELCDRTMKRSGFQGWPRCDVVRLAHGVNGLC